ncbi:unnamed protein product [Ectocarpus sp. CCAP 1310/34]|nr:unnamed protein product [Ectocarpus sp. CCAP 1310/34]
MCTGNLFQNNYLDGASIGVRFSETRDNMVIGNTMVGVGESLIDDSDGLVWSVRASFLFWSMCASRILLVVLVHSVLETTRPTTCG